MEKAVDKMVHNESVFREMNEKPQRELEKLRQMAEDTQQEALLIDEPYSLHFVCECSDENCQLRIEMLPDLYQEIHKDRKCFIVVPGHGEPRVEDVIETHATYSIVKKFDLPKERRKHLKQTPTENV